MKKFMEKVDDSRCTGVRTIALAIIGSLIMSMGVLLPMLVTFTSDRTYRSIEVLHILASILIPACTSSIGTLLLVVAVIDYKIWSILFGREKKSVEDEEMELRSALAMSNLEDI